MATETRYADGSTTVLAGCSGVANAYGAPDGTYTTNGNEGTNWTERFSIGNPSNPLTFGATGHAVSVTLRKSATGGGTPTVDVQLHDGGALVRSLSGSASPVTDSTSSLGPFTFASAEVSNGANVQVALVVTAATGSPANRRNVQVDAITVAFDTTEGGSAMQHTDSLALTDDPKVRRPHVSRRTITVRVG